PGLGRAARGAPGARLRRAGAGVRATRPAPRGWRGDARPPAPPGSLPSGGVVIGSPLPGVRLLTRVPLPAASPDDAARLGASVTFFPLVGLAIGAMLAGLDALLRPWLALGVVDALLLVALAAVTGFFHLDG